MPHLTRAARTCALVALVTAGLAGSPGAANAASAAVDQAMRLGDSDPTAALAILEQADAAGDQEASAVLAGTLFFAAPPRQNRSRACAIARRLAEARKGEGWALTASCLLTGTVPSPNRLDAARASARQAIALGAASGGTALFTAYTADPQFNVTGADGQPDAAKLAALAAQPAAQRKLQGEAWTGLSIALERGDPMAASYAVVALTETSAPGNLGRLLALADRSQAVAKRFAGEVNAARRFQSLGGTHASLKVASAAQHAARAAARAGAVRDGAAACEEIELSRIDPGEAPPDASYLPVSIGPLKEAYLVSGHWEERWTYSACGRDVPVQVAFKADGWGGASFAATPAPRPVVRRAP